MELTLVRKEKNDKASIGELSINGVKECDTLEDVDRGLTSDMTAEQIAGIKIQNQTAIPTGTYKVIADQSTRFQMIMPHVLDVPGFEGIRIHSGNSDVDTDGCILLGQYNGTDEDWISGSRNAFAHFWPQLEAALNANEEVTLTIS